MSRPSSPTICFLVAGGAVITTLELVAAACLEKWPSARIVALDTECFNPRTPVHLSWKGPGEFIRLDPREFGIRNFARGFNWNLALNGGRLAFDRMVRKANNLFRKLRPSIVLSCTDNYYGQRAFLKAARLDGVLTVLLQEGPHRIIEPARDAGSIRHRMLSLAHKCGVVEERLPYGGYFHDKILAVSTAYAETFRQSGIDSEKIAVVGVPRFDALLSSEPGRRPPIPKLVYVFQPFVKQGRVDERIAQGVLAEMAAGISAAYDDVPFEFVVRAHPRADGETLMSFCRNLNCPYILSDPVVPLPELLRTATAAIGHYSIGLIESLILGVPIVCVPIPTSGFADPMEAKKQIWTENLGSPVGKNRFEIQETVVEALSNDVQAIPLDRLRDETGVLDGRATERTVDEILTVLRHRHDFGACREIA